MFDIFLALLAITVFVMAVLFCVIISIAWREASKPNYVTKEECIAKLETARTRLGQIANRESINEAHSIANKALKEIS